MLNNNEYLNKLYQSDQPLIIYKTNNGFDVYTDFSKKYLINKENIKNFLNIQTKKKQSSSNSLNCYVGFFGYKLLCENIGIKFPKQKQDTRVDLPTVGLETLKQCKIAGLKGIVLKFARII